MAHFAKLDSDNIVTHVSVVDNWNCVDGSGTEQESIGVAYLQSVHGIQEGVTWKQTSYNGNIRKNYAGIGFSYDAGRDAFIPPKPYNFPDFSVVSYTLVSKQNNLMLKTLGFSEDAALKNLSAK